MMIQKKKWRRPAQVLLSGILAILLGMTGLAATDAGGDGRVMPAAVSYAKVLPKDGNWVTNSANKASVVEEREAVELPLTLSGNMADGESFVVIIESNSLDLSTADLVLLFDNQGARLGKELNYTAVRQNNSDMARCRVEIKVDSMWRNGSNVSLLLIATRTKEGGEVKMTCKNKRVDGFTADTVLRVGEYTIKKQGENAGTVEFPVGLSGVSSVSAAYIISSGTTERVRVMIKDGQVFGLGIREGEVVGGIEFSVANKVYISSLTGKQIATREEMQSIFDALNFSFLRAPDEVDWMARQADYSTTRSFSF